MGPRREKEELEIQVAPAGSRCRGWNKRLRGHGKLHVKQEPEPKDEEEEKQEKEEK